VRRTQGAFYKQRGGVILGVVCPTAGPSPYAFDKFDQSQIDYWIFNDPFHEGKLRPLARRDLEARVEGVINTLQAKAA